ncbi:7TM diverse intracellular signaling domain-containing protein [Deltaproteobacteria bacterium TL4]
MLILILSLKPHLDKGILFVLQDYFNPRFFNKPMKLHFISIITGLLILSACQGPEPLIPPKVKAGVMDLSSWNLQKNGTLKLEGEWELYWQQFLEPTDFQLTQVKPTLYFPVPKIWNHYEQEGLRLSGKGYATYRLKVLIPSSLHGQIIAIYVTAPASAYRLWINGEEKKGNGKVGKSAEEMNGLYLPRIFHFVAQQENEIVFQISNFIHREGGMWQAPSLGTVDSIQKNRDTQLQFELFLVGSLLIMGCYHLGLFALRQKDLSPLYFGLFCVIFAFRASVTGERFLVVYLADYWELSHAIEYLTFYMAPPIFIMFLYSLFPKENIKAIVILFQVVGLIFSLIVISVRAVIYTHTLIPYQWITIVSFFYEIYVIFFAIRRKREGSLLLLCGFIAIVTTAINDLLCSNQIIYTGFFVPFGLFLFIFFQSYILSMKFSRAFTLSEELTDHLEEKVEQRTYELNRALQETTQKEQEITHINKVMQAVNSTLSLSNVMASVTEALKSISTFDVIGILLKNEEEQWIKIHRIYGKTINDDLRERCYQIVIPFDSKESTQTGVMQRRTPLYVKEIDEDALLPSDRKLFKLLKFKSIISFPLNVQNTTIGTITFINLDQVLELSTVDIDKIERYVTQIATSVLNAKFYEQSQETQKKIQEKNEQLEANYTELLASNRKLEDLNTTKEQLLHKLNSLQENEVQTLQKLVNKLLKEPQNSSKEELRKIAREVHQIEETLRPVTSLHLSEKAIQSKRVLLAESDKKQQIIAKMALGGTGVELDIVSTIEQGQTLLQSQHYDIICTNVELIELSAFAHTHFPQIQSVFMTSENVSSYIPILKKYPHISNIVSRNDEDRTFTLKNIITTISKLLTEDLFSLEKYLSWGVEVHQHEITRSDLRSNLVDTMNRDLENLGVRRSILAKCAMVTEELLMNAIYDAPVDASGKSLYNHLPRTDVVVLRQAERGKLRYACDGLLLAISVEDPFGAFGRKTILDYLESCYEGRAGSLNTHKGGAGRGLFHILETSDLVVFNVKPHVRTEVIAIFNIDPGKPKSEKNTSFHYFAN